VPSWPRAITTATSLQTLVETADGKSMGLTSPLLNRVPASDS